MSNIHIHNAILNGEDKYFALGDVELDFLFFNKLIGPYYGYIKYSNAKQKEEHGQIYRLNSYGFRGDEITSDTDVLFAGCSHTFGVGLPEHYSWPSLVGDSLNTKSLNMGYPGASTTSIVNNIFAYCREFGNPKLIVCYFPDVTRIIFPISKNFIQTDRTNKKAKYASYNYLDHEYLRQEYNVPVFSKKPHSLKDVIPEDVPYWMAMQSINMLEQYCDQAGIKLVWSTWEKPVYRAIEKMNKKDNSYFKYAKNISIFNWINTNKSSLYHKDEISTNDLCHQGRNDACENILNCHEDLKQENPDIFDVGTDDWHWGTHRHRHIADAFLQEISKL
jgi:hypothetical protein